MHMLKVLGELVWVRALILVAFVGFAVWIYIIAPQLGKSEYLKVVFFDVGQGDSIFIETPDGVQVLIDGGSDNTVVRKLSKELGFWDRSLDVVLGTHPDKDHVGGLNDVFDRYTTETIITTENTGESDAASAYLNTIRQHEGSVVYARRGQVYQLGASTTLTILFPDRDPQLLESNTASVIAQLTYGDVEFLLTGDAPKGVEDFLVNEGAAALESEVLKLGHHGSDTSTSDLFLSVVQPQFAVVSAGLENRYGHPHPAVLDRLERKGVPVVGTLGLGDVVFYSDGVRVWQPE